MSARVVENPLSVVGVGMASPLGLTAAGSCAAARAGILRISDVPEVQTVDPETVENVPLRAHVVRGRSEGFTGIGRLYRLGQIALDDLARQPDLGDAPAVPTALLVSVSDGALERHVFDEGGEGGEEPWEEVRARWEQDCSTILLRRWKAFTGVEFELAHSRVYPTGMVGFAQALERARELVTSGIVARCIVGSVESRSDPAMLGALTSLDLARTPDRPDRAIPGEAAAFIALAADRGQRGPSRGAVFATVTTRDLPDFGDEESRPEGRALAEALGSIHSHVAAQGRRVRGLIGDLNGSTRRAMDFGSALVALPAPLRSLPVQSTGEAFGDVGGAAAVAACAMALHRGERVESAGGTTLVFASSESGDRCAIAVESSIARG